MVSCKGKHTGRVNLYNNEEILDEGDSFSSDDYQRSDQKLGVKGFCGTYTIEAFDLEGEIRLMIDWEFTKGEFRILWITADHEIIELEKGTHNIALSEGMNRLKIIANDLSGYINWEIEYL